MRTHRILGATLLVVAGLLAAKPGVTGQAGQTRANKIAFRPAPSVVLKRSGPALSSKLFSGDSILAAITRIEGVSSASTVHTNTGEKWGASIGHRNVEVDLAEGAIAIVDNLEPVATVHVPESAQALYERARPLFEAIGVSDNEIVLTERGVGRIGPGGVGGAEKAERVETVLYVHRTVGGIPVAGDRLVGRFGPSGKFRDMIGCWRHLEGPVAGRRTMLTTAEFWARAGVQAQTEGVNLDTLDTGHSARLETVLAPVASGGGVFGLRLRGRLQFPFPSPAGQVAMREIEFPVDQ